MLNVLVDTVSDSWNTVEHLLFRTFECFSTAHRVFFLRVSQWVIILINVFVARL